MNNEEKGSEGNAVDSKKILDAIVLLKHKEGMASKRTEEPKEGISLVSIVQKLTRNYEGVSKKK